MTNTGLAFFAAMCMQFAGTLGVKIESIEASTLHPNLRAWIANCGGAEDCPARLFLNTDNVDVYDRPLMEWVAAHEVCHVKAGDYQKWPFFDESERRARHKKNRECMRDLVGIAKFWRYIDAYGEGF